MQKPDEQVRGVGICHGPRCGDYGGKALLAELRARGIDAVPTDCRSLCPHAPIASLPGRCLMRATAAEIRQALDRPCETEPW